MVGEQASGSRRPDDPLYAPGLKNRPHARYWVPPAKDIKAGYPTKSERIPNGLSEYEVAALCREQWAALENWRSQQERPKHERGTWDWIIDRYRNDEESPFNRIHPGKGRGLRDNTKREYEAAMQKISPAIGKRTIVSTQGPDLLRWYGNWSKGEKYATAHKTVTHLRRLAEYAVFLGVDEAARVSRLFETVTFHGGKAREVYHPAETILQHVNKAVEMGYISIAIATLAQFEFTERRVHIIGQWQGKGIARRWDPGWVWDGIQYGQRIGITDDWRVIYFQDKVTANRREYDLTKTPALLDMLQSIPESDRHGPVIICEDTGHPWNALNYAKKFREIADAAKLPKEFRSMDMRASGATELGEMPGVTLDMLKTAGGWKSEASVNRYRRSTVAGMNQIVELRQKAREGK